MKRVWMGLLGVFALLAIAGCATPKIDAGQYVPPKTVVIADFPDIHPVATIGVYVANWPEVYFSERFDGFYAVNGISPPQAAIADNAQQINQVVTNQIVSSPQPVSIGQAAAIGAIGGLMGAMIQASAEETQKKAANFPELVRKALPGTDLRADLLKAVQDGLESQGVRVRISGDSRHLPLRLRWPANPQRGENLPKGMLLDSSPVDADLLVQIAPIAFYAAPGPLNNYSRVVGITVALFHGRTRQFIGWQAFPFRGGDGDFSYMRYDSLVEDVGRAAPALRYALMSLVPQVVDAISGRQAR